MRQVKVSTVGKLLFEVSNVALRDTSQVGGGFSHLYMRLTISKSTTHSYAMTSYLLRYLGKEGDHLKTYLGRYLTYLGKYQ